jgi:hypothetical protein
MWILPERYDRKERVFGISPECFKPVNFALAKDQKLTGFFVSKSPAPKTCQEKISLEVRYFLHTLYYDYRNYMSSENSFFKNPWYSYNHEKRNYYRKFWEETG